MNKQLYVFAIIFTTIFVNIGASEENNSNQNEVPLRNVTTLSEQLLDAAHECDPNNITTLLERCNPNDPQTGSLLAEAFVKAIATCTQHPNGPAIVTAFTQNKHIDLKTNSMKDGITYLLRASYEAAKTGNLRVLKKLLDLNANPLDENQFPNDTVSTLEMHTINLKDKEDYPHNDKVIELLEKSVSDRHAKTQTTFIEQLPPKKQKEIALTACKACDVSTLKIALQYLSKSDKKFQQELLDIAIQCKIKPEIIDILAEHGVNFNSPLSPVKTLFLVAEAAARDGDTKILAKMIEHGADSSRINIIDGKSAGSTLQALQEQFEFSPEDYPAKDQVICLLTPYIAHETWNRLREIFKGL